MNSIHISIYIATYIAPLRGNYSEALPAHARPKNNDLLILQPGIAS